MLNNSIFSIKGGEKLINEDKKKIIKQAEENDKNKEKEIMVEDLSVDVEDEEGCNNNVFIGTTIC